MILVCLLWVVWCAMHSILIDPFVTDFINSKFPGLFRYYRLFYNGFSFFTLLPLIVATHVIEGPVIFSWTGYSIIWRGALLAIAFLLFRAGGRHYDLQQFLGTRQARTGDARTLISEGDDIFEGGIFAVTRHPWYLGTLLLIWSVLRDYGLVELFVGTILSIYLVIGCLLEERKILAVYDEKYRDYQQKVSMLFPLKWIGSKLRLQ